MKLERSECINILQAANNAQPDAIKSLNRRERNVLNIAIKAVEKKKESVKVPGKVKDELLLKLSRDEHPERGRISSIFNRIFCALHLKISSTTLLKKLHRAFLPEIRDFHESLNDENLLEREDEILKRITSINGELKKVDSSAEIDELLKYRTLFYEKQLSFNFQKFETDLSEAELDALHDTTTALLGLFSALVVDRQANKVVFLEPDWLEDCRQRAKELLEEIEARQLQEAGPSKVVEDFVGDFLEPYLSGRKNREQEIEESQPSFIDRLEQSLEDKNIELDEPLQLAAVNAYVQATLQAYSKWRREAMKAILNEKGETIRVIEYTLKDPDVLMIDEDSESAQLFFERLKKLLEYEFNNTLTAEGIEKIYSSALDEFNENVVKINPLSEE